MKNVNQVFQFKTNINCSGCTAAVKPYLDKMNGIGDWKVDTTNKDKILTVQSTGISKEQVIDAVQKAGYKIESYNK
ncbi:MAG TPA: heavy-metal-associated domain-containing protein [Chitinophagaceae bacterium]|jgi:copper chaperone|nr:heavy-metal-associated domain-containing protein [Chitinophagaceae bacterium]